MPTCSSPVLSILRTAPLFPTTAPAVADLTAAGNWAQEYLEAESHAKMPPLDWSAEFLEGKPQPMAAESRHTDSQWAQDYLEQGDSKTWWVRGI